jgi:hypothetical protein
MSAVKTMDQIRWTMVRWTLLLVGVVSTCYACSFGKPDIASIPDHPTFEADVLPLLADHCLLCHGYPAKREAPTDFRLDVYDYDKDHNVRGAGDNPRHWVESIEGDEMPPAARWGDGVGKNGKGLLRRWLADNAPP